MRKSVNPLTKQSRISTYRNETTKERKIISDKTSSDHVHNDYPGRNITIGACRVIERESIYYKINGDFDEESGILTR